jgi:hypothetical protein
MNRLSVKYIVRTTTIVCATVFALKVAARVATPYVKKAVDKI